MHYSRYQHQRIRNAALALAGVLALPFVCVAMPHEHPLLSPRDIETRRVIKHSVYIETGAENLGRVPLAIGSGLVPIATVGDTTIVLSVSDRGPNISAAEPPAKGPEQVIFPLPDFNPVIVPLAIKGHEVSPDTNADKRLSQFIPPLGRHLPITDSSGVPLSGLPAISGSEQAVDPSLEQIQQPAEARPGIDPEGIAYDLKRGRVFVAEEYSPSIFEINRSTGRIESTRSPGKGLPKLLSKRAPNRGFEAITYTPSDNLVAILQSPLRDVAADKAESFVRIIIVPADAESTAAARTLPLPLPVDAHPKSYKIGDVVALSDSRFLAFEAYESRDDEKHYHIILLDTSRAKEIDSEQFIDDASKITGPVQKKIVLDFKDLDWASGKIEGLAVINPKTLLISKDNDFGIKLAKNKKPKDTVPKVTFKDVPTEFLFVELRKPILEYLPVM